MRVTIIRIVINFPPESHGCLEISGGLASEDIVFSKPLRLLRFTYIDENRDGKEGIWTKGDWSDTTIADGCKDSADIVH